MKSDILT